MVMVGLIVSLEASGEDISEAVMVPSAGMSVAAVVMMVSVKMGLYNGVRRSFRVLLVLDDGGERGEGDSEGQRAEVGREGGGGSG